MAAGGRVGFEAVAWFNGGLFDDGAALPLEAADIETVLAASDLDWSEIDPSILGTLFERGLDPGKRAQLGAHYTDRDKIMLLVEPVVIRPWLAEWDAAKAEIAGALDRVEAAKSPAARTKRLNAAERRYRAFLNRLRVFTVLDPACGSGNFLYLALQALKDLEHRVQLEAEALGFQRAFPDIGPANVKGLEINPYAAELARVSVWIGEIQWMRRNGFYESRDPILKPLDTIECRDAILAPDSAEPDWPKADVVIVADPKGVIVAGETRYKAAVLIGLTAAPVVTIPARQARAFRVIDNRTSELTSWDTDLLLPPAAITRFSSTARHACGSRSRRRPLRASPRSQASAGGGPAVARRHGDRRIFRAEAPLGPMGETRRPCDCTGSTADRMSETSCSRSCRCVLALSILFSGQSAALLLYWYLH